MRLGIERKLKAHVLDPRDPSSVAKLIAELRPDEVYNLAGPTTIRASLEDPTGTRESIVTTCENILGAIDRFSPESRFFSAGSAQCFGDTGEVPAAEGRAFCPTNPYAEAKVNAFERVREARRHLGLFACSGILFSHESPLRSVEFVTAKVVKAACRIAAGSSERLTLGDIGVVRDWGWAPDYVVAMWLVLQADRADDFVIATGVGHTIGDLVTSTFSCLGLDWRDHVVSDSSMRHPNDVRVSVGDPSKAARDLGWYATMKLPDIVREMICKERGG